jgi:hypothetical protein
METALSGVLDVLAVQIEKSYANNSLLYSYLEERASLEAITSFLLWDAAQPAFADYLSHWLDLVPSAIGPVLADHIRVERDEQHSRLFRELVKHLTGCCEARPHVDDAILRTLNYTFSECCAREEDWGFFLGGFWATELMSAKRCAQLYRGLRRLAVEDGPLHYLKIHFEADAEHGMEVRTTMIHPALRAEPSAVVSVGRGVHDRLSRSGNYVRWYEANRLFQKPAAPAEAWQSR